MKDVRVFIVDDVPFVQKILTKELSKVEGIKVIGCAGDPYEARRSIVKDTPDVIVLDVEMPKMDGLSFLQKLMVHFPIPTIMCSANSAKSTQYAIKAIKFGAFDFVCKPQKESDLHLMIEHLVAKIFEASKVNIEKLIPSSLVVTPHVKRELNHSRFVAIGASTGGTRAIEAILKSLPEDFPGIVITQHMPAEFTKSFADSLNNCCLLHVKEAEDLEEIVPGKVLIAPGNLHLKIIEKDGKFLCNLRTGPLIHYQRPAVDVLFSSISKISHDCIGVILTGMGKDGAQGLLSMREAGCITIAQDEESSVVFGMPRAAIELNAVTKILSLKDISFHLMKDLEL